MWWQKNVSEEQTVEKIRRLRTQFLRWQIPLWLIVILMFGAWLSMMVDFIFRSEKLVGMTGSLPGIAIGWFAGSTLAFILGLFLGIVFALILLCSSETKSWDLMLKYHDRLHEAGLLPAESAEKMECDQNSARE